MILLVNVVYYTYVVSYTPHHRWGGCYIIPCCFCIARVRPFTQLHRRGPQASAPAIPCIKVPLVVALNPLPFTFVHMSASGSLTSQRKVTSSSLSLCKWLFRQALQASNCLMVKYGMPFIFHLHLPLPLTCTHMKVVHGLKMFTCPLRQPCLLGHLLCSSKAADGFNCLFGSETMWPELCFSKGQDGYG